MILIVKLKHSYHETDFGHSFQPYHQQINKSHSIRFQCHFTPLVGRVLDASSHVSSSVEVGEEDPPHPRPAEEAEVEPGPGLWVELGSEVGFVWLGRFERNPLEEWGALVVLVRYFWICVGLEE